MSASTTFSHEISGQLVKVDKSRKAQSFEDALHITPMKNAEDTWVAFMTLKGQRTYKAKSGDYAPVYAKVRVTIRSKAAGKRLKNIFNANDVIYVQAVVSIDNFIDKEGHTQEIETADASDINLLTSEALNKPKAVEAKAAQAESPF